MDIKDLIVDILRFGAAGSCAVVVGYFLIKQDIEKYLKLKSLEVKKDDRSQLLMLRLQANERLILFIERINPPNLFLRLHQHGLTVSEMQAVLCHEIRSEFQHNVSQQLYVNPVIWQIVAELKENTLTMINNAARGFSDSEDGIALGKKVLQQMTLISADPYVSALELIKKDVQQLF